MVTVSTDWSCSGCGHAVGLPHPVGTELRVASACAGEGAGGSQCGLAVAHQQEREEHDGGARQGQPRPGREQVAAAPLRPAARVAWSSP